MEPAVALLSQNELVHFQKKTLVARLTVTKAAAIQVDELVIMCQFLEIVCSK